MDAVPVLDLCYEGRAWLLAPDGTATRAHVPLAHGFGLPWPEPFSAVFVAGGELWLQVGRQRRRVADVEGVRQLLETPSRAVYELHLAGGAVERVEVSFPREVRTWRTSDPTHDEIDSWSEDVLKLLPYVAADGWVSRAESVAEWAARVTPLWAAGLPVG